MRPGEILDAQADLIERLDDPQMDRVIAVLAANHIGKMHAWEHPTKQQTEESEALVEKYQGIGSVLRGHLQVGYAYRVSHDMCQMVKWMSQQIEDTDAFYKELMPSPCGIVCFDDPLPLQDVRGKTMLIHWMMWGPGEFSVGSSSRTIQGTVMWHFNDTWRQPDEIQDLFEADISSQDPEAWENYQRRIGRWATVGMDVVVDGQRMGPLMWEASDEQTELIRSEGFEPQPGTNALRYAQALFLLLGQSITKVSEEEIPRPFRRRAVRKRIPPQVTVIRLRREEYSAEEHGESEVEWSHRWIVRQHLRWQPYGPRRSDHEHVYGPVEAYQGHLVQHCVHEGCESRLERIVIHAHQKGPADKPLIITDKVYSLDR